MAWGKPEFDSSTYNLAGKVLVNGQIDEMDVDTALVVINNWRSSHYHPLNTFQRRLRLKANSIDGNSLVAQRIKRLSSIKHKLERFNTMRLVQIQDIGGCRAIVSTIEHLEKLVAIMASRDEERSSRGLKHKLIFEKDYIKEPKMSGYRGVHLVFKYHSDKIKNYEDLKIEIQFRTFLQHAWATAVETAGIFTGQALKSSIGEKDWLRFFSLASSAMAISEGTALVPETPTSADELRAELRKYYKELDVEGHLKTYNQAMNILDLADSPNAHYYLLRLDAEYKTISVQSFKQGQLEKASAVYLETEKDIANKNIDAVLVSADSVAALRKAYPNYFVDTETFLGFLNRLIVD
jgi:hypothetical protein